MMTTIHRVVSKADLKKFARFNYELYKDNPYSVPDLYSDIMATFRKDKNPAFEFCEAEYFLAYQDNKIVGRVAAIINHKSNEIWDKKAVRFGWIDFIDDPDVSRSLIKAVEKWGLDKGMTEIEGPLGFTDFDAEGMLIEGFDQLSTMATIYNYPYYPAHMERLGFGKATDWIEMKLIVPEKLPEQYAKIAEIVKRRLNLHTRKLKNIREIKKTGIGYHIFELINEAYKPLYGYCELSKAQIEQYVNNYMQIIDLRMVTLVEDAENNLVGVGISMPSLSRALQKAKGKLWPFGWWHIIKALFIKKPPILDLLLVAIKPQYQGKGVNALLFADLIPTYIKMGFKCGETNLELEANDKVQSQWQYLDGHVHKRRRCYTKHLTD
ncbi:MAG: N-acetyltransferase [Bacteroidaceae bacterium]|nr:N-acetyltransferase [Prevotellaceae bacterium]MDY3063428.1 N-acetyltransferase [Bacteroidaceae bacterium]